VRPQTEISKEAAPHIRRSLWKTYQNPCDSSAGHTTWARAITIAAIAVTSSCIIEEELIRIKNRSVAIRITAAITPATVTAVAIATVTAVAIVATTVTTITTVTTATLTTSAYCPEYCGNTYKHQEKQYHSQSKYTAQHESRQHNHKAEGVEPDEQIKYIK
jgi:hypothetical protein